MLCSEAEYYLEEAKGLPFFYAVGDKDYLEILNDLKQKNVTVDRVSDFCPKVDKFPDLDDIIDYFRTLDVDCNSNRHVLIGLGEYFALKGSKYTEERLRKLEHTTLGTARVILLLRGITQEVHDMAEENHRLVQRQMVYISEYTQTPLTATCIQSPWMEGVAKGLKGLLQFWEDGGTGNCYVQTMLEFPGEKVKTTYIRTAYDAISHLIGDDRLQESWGDQEQWERLLKDLQRHENSLWDVFEQYNITDDIDDLYQNCTGMEYKNWLFFLYMKCRGNHIGNIYLSYVVSVTDRFDKLKERILTEIIRIPRSDKRFSDFYTARKKLIKEFSEADLGGFIQNNAVDPQESVYRLTDSTNYERREILLWIAQNGYNEDINTIYPALGLYLNEYRFDCGALSDRLTQYFNKYKMLKVTNTDSPDFLQEEVLPNARELPYTDLETRNSAILKVKDKENAFLYWVDALGVEYLSYITALAREKGLRMHVDIVYADLPTITSVNRGFYDDWTGPKKDKNPDLDNIKHKDEGKFNFQNDDESIAPVHLSAELKVIEEVMERASMELVTHKCRSFVIASDHGASRLAVIHRGEKKQETDTKGEHSGRCCKASPNIGEIENSVEENGYLVLADYDRFGGSRKANVEVHGGASLEEVVVPLITLTLKQKQEVQIKVQNQDAIYADRHEGTTIVLGISEVDYPDNVSVVLGEERYPAKHIQSNQYSVRFPGLKRSKKKISASVYDGEDVIGNIEFDIQSKTAKMDNSLDALFEEDF